MTSRTVTVAAIQMSMAVDVATNVATAERLVRVAAASGAQVILIPELFEGHYFCKDQRASELARALPIEGHPTIEHFMKLAQELGVVLPISVYERANNTLFNTVAMIDADGSMLGIYRKSHIPDGPGYTEKYYFSPGDTGFQVWNTRFGNIGVGICWDQWFPEAARAMALMGAELLLYPTAIGSEPPNPTWDSSMHWQRVMQGHAGANLMPVIAANRTGREVGVNNEITFYGSSFIADATGAKVAEADREEETVLTATFDLDAVRAMRLGWGVFRDRRPELYIPLITLDGDELS
ncbi:MAG: N-carbamoylputrescine amidase [Acidimicrobium sp. BACL17 MAG-120823-bin42]|jgi:N-carbamoylputrescine amidase|nr:MAG: N-carbamoylputrescine amidase [Acidimicrobium sp. BACL17 MAG-120823-bin42]